MPSLLYRLLKGPLYLIDALVEKHKAIRRLLVVWAVVLITLVTMEIVNLLAKMNEVTTAVTSLYLGVTGLLGTVIGFYQWARTKDDKHDDQNDSRHD